MRTRGCGLADYHKHTRQRRHRLEPTGPSCDATSFNVAASSGFANNAEMSTVCSWYPSSKASSAASPASVKLYLPRAVHVKMRQLVPSRTPGELFSNCGKWRTGNTHEGFVTPSYCAKLELSEVMPPSRCTRNASVSIVRDDSRAFVDASIIAAPFQGALRWVAAGNAMRQVGEPSPACALT